MSEQVAEAPRASRVKERSFSRGPSFAERVVPEWGREAARWFLAFHDPTAWAVGIAMALVALAIGAALVFGNGLLSIKGVWFILEGLGVPIERAPVPALAWWAIPAVLFFLQAVGRHIKPLRWLWRPSVVFDGTTTALYVARGLLAVVALEYAGAAGALLGLLIAVGADRALMGAAGMLWELWKHR